MPGAAADRALRFVEENGIVLMSARGAVPNLAEFVAGEPIRGSWWGHRRGQDIFRAAEAVGDSPSVLTCRLVAGKVTFVHRRLWPALVRLAGRLPPDGLARVWQEHTASGRHQAHRAPFPEWVPADVSKEAETLTAEDAERALSRWWPALVSAPRRASKR